MPVSAVQLAPAVIQGLTHHSESASGRNADEALFVAHTPPDINLLDKCVDISGLIEHIIYIGSVAP